MYYDCAAAHDFESWGLEPLRYPAAATFMGRGVFTSDGPFWQHARAQVKPVLVKAQFTDYGRLEFHLQNLFALLPEDGNDVNIAPLLERMVSRASERAYHGYQRIQMI